MIYPWQHDVWQRLMSGKAHLPNALMLQGRSGIGKLHLGSVLAQALLCDSPLANGEPCEQCGSCVWIKAGVHPDLRLLEPEAQAADTSGETTDQGKSADKKSSQYITVAQVRELADFMNLTTHRNGLRIVLIHPAEAMNIHAANALLKTLEEPAAGTLFILVSHHPQRLLPTVRSRCQKINVPLPDRAAAVLWLQQQGVTDTESCLAQSGYAPLTALQLSDEVYQTNRRQLYADFGSPDKLDPLSMAEWGDKLGLAWMLDWMQQWAHDLASTALAGQARYQAKSSPEMIHLAKTINLIELFKFQQELSSAQRTLQHPLNNRLLLEQLLFSYWRIANCQKVAHV